MERTAAHAGIVPFSASDYFARLAAAAEDARGNGNYAIAAALVVRHAGTELILLGRNTLFASGDPTGHAEINAIRHACRIGSSPPGQRRELLESAQLDGSAVLRACSAAWSPVRCARWR
jgi:tRNA(Arg) A34 adenosine deaminase TadA